MSAFTTMSMSFEKITPEVASRMLSTNVEHNRRVSQIDVDMLAAQIERGEYIPTHQGIAIMTGGKLGDGQHRLAAIVKAGVPIYMWVCRGVPDEAFQKMDKGRRRSIADRLRVERKYSDFAAAMVNQFAPVTCRTDYFVLSLLQSLMPAIEIFYIANSTTKRRGVTSMTASMAVLRIAVSMKKNKGLPTSAAEYAADQYRALMTRDYEEMSKPVAVLNRKIDESIGSKTIIRSLDMACRSWIAFDESRRNIEKIQIKDQATVLAEIRGAINFVWPESPVNVNEDALEIRSRSETRRERIMRNQQASRA